MTKQTDPAKDAGDRTALTSEIIEALREPFLRAYDAWYDDVIDSRTSEDGPALDMTGDDLFRMLAEEACPKSYPPKYPDRAKNLASTKLLGWLRHK